jgi:hypothetical protein
VTVRLTERELVEVLLRNTNCARILTRFSLLALPDLWLVSGALFQTVWNAITQREPTYGIHDYDLCYFDPDTSWGAENRAIELVDHLFKDLNFKIELRNQARVHLWYEEKFGRSYPQLSSTTDGIDRFLMSCAQIGVRPQGMSYEVYAPSGFVDMEHLIVRPNLTESFQSTRYNEKANRWKTVWPELTVIPV